MIRAILLDLDDTLLGNNTATFIPQYFAVLGEHAQQYLEKKRFLEEWLACTQEMIANTDATISNRDAFWRLFTQRTGLDPVELEPFFDQFYRNQFRSLQAFTQVRPVAADLVRSCFAQGLKVVVATNPLFQRAAIEERLAWAGVPVTDFAFDLVTSYENSHATKPHQEYYREILDAIDCVPREALMVGDDWKNDIIPATGLGMFTYWITENGAPPPDEKLVTCHGSLEALYHLVTANWLQQLVEPDQNGSC